MQIRFSSLFFQPVAQPSLHSTAQPSSENIQAISYTPEKYGTWDAFKAHPDYELAKQQYARIFADIYKQVTEHAWHPEPQQQALEDFIIKIYDGQFISREPLLYGEAKRMFDAFHALVMREDIPRETRLTAIRNLSQELHACADGAINSLIGIVRQLQCTLDGNPGEALRIKEQLFEQLIREFCVKRRIRTNMEKHYVAVYHNFLRPRYGLPSLEHDIHAHQASLRITDKDLYDCAEYVKARLSPERVVSVMAEAYLGEVRQTLGAGLPFRQAVNTLTALKIRLTPIYGDIPDALLLTEGSDGQYHAPARDTLIKLALLQTLHNNGVMENPPLSEQLYSRYHVPDTLISRFIPDPATGQFVESGEKQVIRGETVAIYHIGTLWWVQIEGESTPTLLTLMHLLPIIDSLPDLSPQDVINLFSEALRNSSADELAQALPALIKHVYFLYTYLNITFDGKYIKLHGITADLFFKHDLSQGIIRYKALRKTFEQLGLDPHFIDERCKKYFPHKLLKILYATFLQSNPIRPFELTQKLTQNFLLNLLLLGESLQTRLHLSNEAALIRAAGLGWPLLTGRLCQLKTVNLNAIDMYGRTALMIAAEKGHIDIIRSLVKAGADTTLLSQTEGNALSHAVSRGQLTVVEYLLDVRANSGMPNARFDINARNIEGMTPLLRLFKTLYMSPEIRQRILALLLEHGANIHARLHKGRSVLSLRGAISYFDVLVAAGANPYGEDFSQILLNAIQDHEPAIVEKLLQQALAKWGEIPCDNATSLLDTALAEDQIETAIALIPHLQRGLSHADRAFLLDKLSHYFAPLSKTLAEKFIHHLLQPERIQETDENAETFFDAWLDNVREYTGEVATEAVLRQLYILVNYTDISRPMKDGDTLLMHLVKNTSAYTSKPEAENFIFPYDLFPMIRYLAVHTNLLSHPDQNGLTPFSQAVQWGEAKVVRALLKANPALVHSRDPAGNTPLLLAANECRLNIMALLLGRGARVNATNKAGYTALMLSYLHNHQAGIKLLLGAKANQYIKHPGMTGAIPDAHHALQSMHKQR